MRKVVNERESMNASQYNDLADLPVATQLLPKLEIDSSDETNRDWNESGLYRFVQQTHVKVLIKKGAVPSKEDVATPRD